MDDNLGSTFQQATSFLHGLSKFARMPCHHAIMQSVTMVTVRMRGAVASSSSGWGMCLRATERAGKEGILSNHHQAEDGAANSIIRKLEVTYLWYSMPLSRSESYYRIVQPFYG